MRPTRRLVALLGILLATVVAGLAAGPAVANTRIVVLNGDVTEVVFALGWGGRVVAVDSSATYPAAAAQLPKFGYQRALSAEPILAFGPSLILGSSTAGPPAVLDQLRGTGTPVQIIPAPQGLDAVPAKIRRIGTAIGGTAVQRSRRLADTTRARIRRARRSVDTDARKPRVAFLYLRGTRVQQLAGRGSGADSMIKAAGGVDVGTELGISGFRPLTPEALVNARPDVIVTLSAGLQSVGGLTGLLQIPGVAQTPAGQSRRVLAFDDQEFLGLGPRAPIALRALIRGLGTAGR